MYSISFEDGLCPLEAPVGLCKTNRKYTPFDGGLGCSNVIF